MKRLLTMVIAATMIFHSASAERLVITQEHKDRARNLVEQMSLEEKISYLSGETSFSLRPIERLGIPRILLADGPQGIRNHAPHSTLFPSGVLAAASWSRPMMRRYGQSLGDDARARGVRILLGPGVNIYRSPLCGRSYEYMGEDPYLASEMAKEYILGVQERGVLATIKHFAANNQEWNRHHASSDVDRRTLHEIYFPAFRKAVEQAGVGAVMDSYNLLNGVHASENPWLNIDILRKRWGFDGILMSDWTSTYSTVGIANAGLDLEMPKGVYFNMEKLAPEIEAGRIDLSTIDLKVQHLLQTLIAIGALDEVAKIDSLPLDNPESDKVALEMAREGIVLLKNDGGILPLKGTTVVLGPNADATPTGGGSGFVSPFASSTPAAALKEARKSTIVLSDDVLFEDVMPMVYADSDFKTPGFKGEYFSNQKFEGEPAHVRIDAKPAFDWQYGKAFDDMPEDHFSVRWSGVYRPQKSGTIKIDIGGDDGYRLKVNGKTVTGDWGNHAYSSRQVQMPVSADSVYNLEVEYFDNISSATINCSLAMLDDDKLLKALRKADNAVVCVGFNSNMEGEGFDRPFALPAFQQQLIKRVAEVNPNTVVVINAGGGIDMDAWEPEAKAIVMAWYGGQRWGTALADILTGKVNPSGRLPISMERAWADNPCHDTYYDNLKGSEYRRIDYKEGLFTGYRGYDRTGRVPRYPFGYGLSYTTFDFSNLKADKRPDGAVVVTFDVTNTGKREGAEVAQVYVSDVQASVPRPEKELKGFEKVSLKPGETKSVAVTLDADAFKFFSSSADEWVMEPGEFRISVGNSSASLPLSVNVVL